MASALIAQSGGPTPVINASLVAATRQALSARGSFTRFLGSPHGLKGILKGQIIDLFAQSRTTLDGIATAPGAALGSSRQRLTADDLEQIIGSFRKHDIRWFFTIGGNGSMGAALAVQQAAQASGYELNVIGIPKTVDNDIAVTDHSPGYGSAGRFWAHAVRDMGMDHLALPSPILIAEVMGRNTGWVAAATAFARAHPDDAPHLIYAPEHRLPRAKLLADIEAVYRRIGRVFVCICEGQLDETGAAFGAHIDRPQSPEHRLASDLGHAVARYVSRELKLRVRSERPSMLGRCCSALVSHVDFCEAELCGREAIRAALKGEQGKMVALRRKQGNGYACFVEMVPLEDVAGRQQTMPPEYFTDHDVTPAFLDYAMPLIGEVKPHARLALKHPATG